MLMEKPQCNLRYCRYYQDGNCLNASKYENCTLTDLHYKIAELTVDLENAKADTVREMQDKVRKKIKKTDWLSGRAVYLEIDKIAKEMLEDKNVTKNN